MTVGPKSPNARAMLIAARTMVACPKQRAAFRGCPPARLGPEGRRHQSTRATASEQYRRVLAESRIRSRRFSERWLDWKTSRMFPAHAEEPLPFRFSDIFRTSAPAARDGYT